MKRIFALLLTATLLLSLAACGGDTPAAPADNESGNSGKVTESVATATPTPAGATETPGKPTDEPAAPTDAPVSEHKSVLVVVFSATGTTLGVAKKIAAIENADLYEIKAAQEYTAADLNWNDKSSRTTKEQNDRSSRPAIGSETISLEGYEKIYIGFPIWWGEEPRILDTFVESYNFNGITLIPFCTSGSSGIGRSGKNLAERAGSGNWLDGKRFSGSVSESELRDWINGLK